MVTAWWLPKNPAEQTMADAVARGDEEAYLHALASARLIVPQVLAEGVVQQEGAEVWQPLTRSVAGQIALVVFTSLAGLGSSMLVGSYEEVTYPQLRERWAGPATWLLVNPGSPIEGRLPVAAVDRALRGEAAPTVAPATTPVSGVAEPTIDVDRILNDPEHEVSREEYLEALCESRVILLTRRPVESPEALLEPDFPWHVTGPPQAPVIEAFTSEAAFSAAYPGRSGVETPFLMLMLAWPDGHSLLVNPEGPVRMAWPADQIHLLARRAVRTD